MYYVSRFLLWSVLGLMCVTLGTHAGCGECVFTEPIKGIVKEQTGRPMEGVTITACQGCDPNQLGDEFCVKVVTDKEGRFTMDVPHCRPKAFDCATRPMVFTHTKCKQKVVQLKVPASRDEQTFTIECK